MKNFKWLLFVLISVFALSLFVACNGLPGGDTDGNGTSTEQSSTGGSSGDSTVTPGETPSQPGETPSQPGETPSQPGETPDQPSEGFIITLRLEGKETAINCDAPTPLIFALYRTDLIDNLGTYTFFIDGKAYGLFHVISEATTIEVVNTESLEQISTTISFSYDALPSEAATISVPAGSTVGLAKDYVLSSFFNILYSRVFTYTVNGEEAFADTVLKDGDALQISLPASDFTFVVSINGNSQELYGYYDTPYNLSQLIYLMNCLTMEELLEDYTVTVDGVSYNGGDYPVTKPCTIVITAIENGDNEGGGSTDPIICPECGDKVTSEDICPDCKLCYDCCECDWEENYYYCSGCDEKVSAGYFCMDCKLCYDCCECEDVTTIICPKCGDKVLPDDYCVTCNTCKKCCECTTEENYYNCRNCGNKVTAEEFCVNCKLCYDCCECNEEKFYCNYCEGYEVEKTTNVNDNCPYVTHFYCNNCQTYFIPTDDGSLIKCDYCTGFVQEEEKIYYPCGGRCTYEAVFEYTEICWNCKLCLKTCCRCNSDENELTRFAVSIMDITAAGPQATYYYTVSVYLDVIAQRYFGESWGNYFYSLDLKTNADTWLCIDSDTLIYYSTTSFSSGEGEGEGDDVIIPDVVLFGVYVAYATESGAVEEGFQFTEQSTTATITDVAKQFGIALSNYYTYLDGEQITDYSYTLKKINLLSFIEKGLVKVSEEGQLNFMVEMEITDAYGATNTRTEPVYDSIISLIYLPIDFSLYTVTINGFDLSELGSAAQYFPIFRDTKITAKYTQRVIVYVEELEEKSLLFDDVASITINRLAELLGVSAEDYVWRTSTYTNPITDYNEPLIIYVGTVLSEIVVYANYKISYFAISILDKYAYEANFVTYNYKGNSVAFNAVYTACANTVANLSFDDYYWYLGYGDLSRESIELSLSDVIPFGYFEYVTDTNYCNYVIMAFPKEYVVEVFDDSGNKISFTVNGKTTIENILNMDSVPQGLSFLYAEFPGLPNALTPSSEIYRYTIIHCQKEYVEETTAEGEAA